jgi:thiol-disulfide isomerase/thioredoxin
MKSIFTGVIASILGNARKAGLPLALLTGVALFAADSSSLRKAPELTFSLPGKGTQQLSQYRGKVVALEFIFTTCPHCQAASKVMTKFQEEYGARGLQAIDIAVNANADLLVDNFVKEYKVGFPVGWVSQEQMTAFMGFTDGRFVVPQLALIDRKGVIHYQTPGKEDDNWDKLMTEDSIRAHIEELLNLGNTSTSSTAAHKKALSGLDVPARY